jgi:hypothetical protein
VFALIKFKNGTTEKKEFYNGTSFLSQSARFIEVTEQMTGITIQDNKGQSRPINF